MMKQFKALLPVVLICIFGIGCSHQLKVTNLGENYVPPPQTPNRAITLGVKSPHYNDGENSRYVSAVVHALRRTGNFNQVLYPYDRRNFDVAPDATVDIFVNPKYSGEGTNFLINWPGFLIFAPAAFGYGYRADIDTRADISFLGTNKQMRVSVPLKYKMRHAEIDRTWTEIGWLEFGIIPLFGGFYMTSYDPDVTYGFIGAIYGSYGDAVAKRISEAIYNY